MTCTVHKHREAPAAHAAAFSVAHRTYSLHDANFNVTARVTRFTLIGDGTQDAGQWDEVEPDVWVWVEGTGWYDNRHRVYSATMARFGQAEPYGAEYIDGANLYWGLGNNPGNRVDPSGLGWFSTALNAVNDTLTKVRLFGGAVAQDGFECAVGALGGWVNGNDLLGVPPPPPSGGIFDLIPNWGIESYNRAGEYFFWIGVGFAGAAIFPAIPVPKVAPAPIPVPAF